MGPVLKLFALKGRGFRALGFGVDGSNPKSRNPDAQQGLWPLCGLGSQSSRELPGTMARGGGFRL